MFAATAVVAMATAVGITSWALSVFQPDWSIDVSNYCFDANTTSVFNTWLAVCGVAVAVLVILRGAQLWGEQRELPQRPRVVLGICTIIATALALAAIPFLVLLCPVYAWENGDAFFHFVFALLAIGLLYLYCVLHVVVCVASACLSRRHAAHGAKPEVLTVVLAAVQATIVVAGVVCIAWWVTTELAGQPFSQLEWAGILLIFAAVLPIALRLALMPCLPPPSSVHNLDDPAHETATLLAMHSHE